MELDYRSVFLPSKCRKFISMSIEGFLSGDSMFLGNSNANSLSNFQIIEKEHTNQRKLGMAPRHLEITPIHDGYVNLLRET